jgi:hypothetical protein
MPKKARRISLRTEIATTFGNHNIIVNAIVDDKQLTSVPKFHV